MAICIAQAKAPRPPAFGERGAKSGGKVSRGHAAYPFRTTRFSYLSFCSLLEAERDSGRRAAPRKPALPFALHCLQQSEVQQRPRPGPARTVSKRLPILPARLAGPIAATASELPITSFVVKVTYADKTLDRQGASTSGLEPAMNNRCLENSSLGSAPRCGHVGIQHGQARNFQRSAAFRRVQRDHLGADQGL